MTRDQALMCVDFLQIDEFQNCRIVDTNFEFSGRAINEKYWRNIHECGIEIYLSLDEGWLLGLLFLKYKCLNYATCLMIL